MSDVRNMKTICSILHRVRQGYDYSALEVTDDMIETAERVYHDMKENNA